MRFNLWIAALMLPAAYAILVFGEGMVERSDQLSKRGVTTIAQVERGWTEHTRNSPIEWLEVTYQAEGESYTVAGSVTQNTRLNAVREGTIEIRYFKDDPSVFEFGPGSATLELWIVRGVGLLVFLIGAYWLWKGLTRIRQLFWLEKHGTRERRHVKRVDETGWNTKDWEFRLVWSDPDGSEGRSLMASEYRLKAHPPGSEIDVLRDPAGRVPSAWVGDLAIWP